MTNFSSPLFTIEVPKNVGLSDQVWHLDQLYHLGRSPSYTYVHSPFTCPRSYRSSWWQKIGFYLKKGFFSTQQADRLIKFLGLEDLEPNINNSYFRKWQKIIINIDKILEKNTDLDISQLKQIIQSNSSAKEIIYVFSTEGLYPFTFQIDQLIQQAESKGIAQDLNFADQYWQARSKMPINIPFDPNKIKILLHIRKGDTACVQLNHKTIYTHGAMAKIANSFEELNGYFRKPVEDREYHLILHKIFAKYGNQAFSTIVISDGYNGTFRTILKSLLKEQIYLNFKEIIQLIIMQLSANSKFEDFLSYSDTSIIIGEYNQNLLKSIQASVC